MIHARGLLPDDGRHKRDPFRSLKLKGAPSGFADLTPNAPHVLDQNYVGSCAPHSVAAAVPTSLPGLGYVPSPRELYALALRIDRADDHPLTPVDRLPFVSDSGTRLLTCVEAISRWGVIPMGPRVNVGGQVRESDCGPANALKDPQLGELERAAETLLIGAYEIAPGEGAAREIALALDAGIAVVCGGWVDSTFDAYEGGVIGPQNIGDPYGGGHALAIIGYRTAGNGSLEFRIRNSWSESWGLNGDGWVNEAFIRERWEVFALAVRRAV